MNVLSLFDGMSCGQIALDQLGIKVDNYYAAEIDKWAIQVAKKNYPNTIHLGDVTQVKGEDLPEIDLLIGGSPCQGFSFAGKQLNFDDPRSALFFEFVRLLEETKPKYFMLENVRMKQEYQDVISEYLGVKPIMINSALVSAQNRVRLYWTNIPNVEQPEDQFILLDEILEGLNSDEIVPSITLKVQEATKKGYTEIENGGCFDITFPSSKTRRGRNMKHKCNCLTATNYDYMRYEYPNIRKLTPIECERLQTVPDNYTDGVSNSQRYKMLGNGWTVEVIKHIFKNM